MNDKPDFIVDPSGKTWDVRGQKHSQGSQFSSQQNPGTGSSSPNVKILHPIPSSQGSSRPGGIIFIPIGLIITLIIIVLNSLNEAPAKNTYSELSVSSLNLGLSYYHQGDYEKALININLALDSEPEMGEAYNDRGLVYDAMGEAGKAIADYNQALELNAQYKPAQDNRNLAYEELKKRG